MPDNRFDRNLSQFWHELIAAGGPVAGERDLDPDLAETLRQLHAMTQTPPPAGASGRVDRTMLPRLMAPNNGKVTTMDGTFALNRGLTAAGGWSPPQTHPRTGHANRRRLARVNWASLQTATALLIILALLMGYFITHQHHPAIVGPAQGTPTTIATPNATPNSHAWPIGQGGNAARTRNMPGPAPVGQPKVLWTFPGPGAQSVGPIADYSLVADGVLYAPSSLGYLAIATTNGKELWRSTAGDGGGAIDGDGIILRSAKPSAAGYDLVRISRKDGSVVWRAEQGKILSENWTPDVAEGIGYMPSGSDLLAFNPATGKARWRATLQVPASRGAAVAGGMAVLGDQKGMLYGISTADGKIVWTHPTGSPSVSTPSITNGMAYVTIAGGSVSAYVALDLATGKERWHATTDVNAHFSNGAINASTVYATNTDGALYALDSQTGALRWKFQTSGTSANNPSLIGDTVFLDSQDGSTIAVDTTSGKERWRVPLNSVTGNQPVIVDGVLYASTSSGQIYAIGGSNMSVPAAAAPATSSPIAPATPNAAVVPTPAAFLWQTAGGSSSFVIMPGPNKTLTIGNIAVAPDGRLWAADGPRNQFQIFNPDGSFAETWGTPGSGDGQFNFQRKVNGDRFGQVAFAPDGSFYVADEGNFRIQKFDRTRKFLFAWGSPGTGDGQFLSPMNIAIDAHGNVFVNDDLRNDVQKFSPDGRFLLKFGGKGSGDGQLDFQAFMAVDGDGNAWVTDPANHRVEVWDTNGRFLASWTGQGQLIAPVSIAIDSQRHVYVGDAAASRIYVLDAFDNVIGSWGGPGAGDGQFTAPTAVALDGKGNIYVADNFGPVTRIQKFKLLPPLAPSS